MSSTCWICGKTDDPADFDLWANGEHGWYHKECGRRNAMMIQEEFRQIQEDKAKELRFFMEHSMLNEIQIELLAKTFPVLDFFKFDHLPEGQMRATSAWFHEIAWAMAQKETKRHAELAAGLRKLLEAKDCFVRAMLP